MANDNVRWVRVGEEEEATLKLTYIQRGYWKDLNDKYWFNDETETEVCGPYDTLKACKDACYEYALTL